MRGLRLAVGMVAVFPVVASAQTPAGPPPLQNLTHAMCTARLELFAEFRSLVVGESVRITAHLTKVASDSTRVYLRRTPERFELREVKTGRTVADQIEITSGLRQGERIVVKGADAMPRRN